MTTPVKDDDWGSATLYAGTRPFEPPTIADGDPVSSLLIAEWDDRVEPRWGTTTYVGKPHRSRRATKRSAPASTAADQSDASADNVIVDPALVTAIEQDVASDSSAAAPAIGAHAVATEAAEDVTSTNRGLLAASGSIAVGSLVSRVTGFLRSIVLVAALGTGAVGNAYNSGNNFPNMIYELLLGGVLSSVLIPLLVHAQAQDDDDGVAYTQRLLSIATVALGAMTMLAVAAAPWIAAGFVPTGSQRELTSIFATLLLPEIFFYGLGAMFTAVLNIRHVYRPGAWAPVLNNVIVIVAVLVFWALPGPVTLNPGTMTTAQVLVIGIGTSLGIAGQALVLVPSLRRSGFTWQWRFQARDNERGRMREVGALAGWVLAYVVVSQIGVTVIQKVGTENGGFSVFTYADLLFQMPYGILVVSLLTAIMPRMSRAAVRGDDGSVVNDLSLGSRLSAVALIPVTAGLIALGPAMTVTLFAHGRTTLAGAHLIGTTLAWSAFGLFPFALVMLQLRVFYAMRDGRTPALINGFMVATKIVLILVTNDIFRAPAGTDVNLHPSVSAVQWLSIGTSASYVVGAVVGHVALSRRLGRLGFRSVARTVVLIGVASAVGALAAYGVVLGSRDLFGTARAGSATGLVLGAVVGLAVMGAVAWRMRIPELRQVLTMVRG